MRALALFGLALLLALACSSTTTPPRGEIMLAITSDMAAPQDFDRIRLEVRQQSLATPLLARDYLIPSETKLPLTLGIVAGSNPAELITLRVEAKRGEGTVRVGRDVIATVPADRIVTLPIVLQWLCVDKVCPDSADAQQTTCIAGSCASPRVDPNTLPPYPLPGAEACFDTLGCFAGGSLVAVDAPTCSIAKPAASGTLNVALRSAAPGGPGVCSASDCLVALDADRRTGWWEEAGRIHLPPAVCGRDGVAVALSAGPCVSKGVATPVCGPASAVGPPATPDAGPLHGAVPEAGPPAADACAPEPPAQLCQRAGRKCGPFSTTDCTGPRTVSCGTCPDGQPCTEGQCVCTPTADPDLCRRAGKTCGPLPVENSGCGAPRTVPSCGDCPAGQTCGAQVPGVCSPPDCRPETDGQFCARFGRQCGLLSNLDSCGKQRTVTTCGTCPAGQVCTSQGTCCTPQSNAELCTAAGRRCGVLSTVDRCNAARSIASCGPCTGGQVCNAQGACACPAGMQPIPGGTYTMGCATGPSNNGICDNLPAQPVTVNAFCLDTTEVTVAAYRSCTSCSAPSTGSGGANSCNWGVSGRDNHPINCVDWNQAGAYCQAVGKRLPNEQEWEWAARGGPNGWTYPWGNTAPSDQLLCWSGSGTNRSSTCLEGSFPAEAFGLVDMGGNVWEWTASNYDTSTCVIRGGGWLLNLPHNLPACVRGACRYSLNPPYRGVSLGFRCAR